LHEVCLGAGHLEVRLEDPPVDAGGLGQPELGERGPGLVDHAPKLLLGVHPGIPGDHVVATG